MLPVRLRHYAFGVGCLRRESCVRTPVVAVSFRHTMELSVAYLLYNPSCAIDCDMFVVFRKAVNSEQCYLVFGALACHTSFLTWWVEQTISR